MWHHVLKPATDNPTSSTSACLGLTWVNKKAPFLYQPFPRRCTKKLLQTLSWYKCQNLEMHRANLVCHLSTAFYPHTREKSKCANMLAQSGALCSNKHLCCQIRLAERDNKHRAENPPDVLHLNQTERRGQPHTDTLQERTGSCNYHKTTLALLQYSHNNTWALYLSTQQA